MVKSGSTLAKNNMSQMLELIRNNAVPAAVIRTAARGALSVPASEMLQILVHLTSNAVFGQEAAMTLAGWDPASAAAVVSGSDAPQEVVDYFLRPENRRPGLLPALIENVKVSGQCLVGLANSSSREVLEAMLASPRVRGTPDILQTLLKNSHLTEAEAQQILQEIGQDSAAEPPDPETEAAHESWKQEHAAQIAAEEGTAFELTGAPDESVGAATSASTDQKIEPAAAAPEAQEKLKTPASPKRVSTIVKISRMNVAERVKTGFLGSKEERAILIRDTAKIVQNAVLASPKLSEAEVETFSAAKNVSENVLREIARSRRFMKLYSVVRNLVFNPRCPLDLSLTLVKNLLVMDLKNLQGNKGVPDTLRKVALKLFKEKTTPVGQKPE